MASRQDIEAGRAFVRLYIKNAEFEAGIKNAKKLLGDFADSLKSVGKAMLALGATGAGGVLFTASKFASFDDALRAARAASEFTVSDMKTLSKTAKELAVALGYLPIEVATLMAHLARADIRLDELPQATKSVLEMARATGTDAAMAGDIFASTLRMFGKEAKEIPHVVDAITIAANKSLISVTDLGNSLKYSGPVAKSFGMSMEEAVAVTAALGRMGIQNENAGTALRRMLTDMAGDSKRLAAVLGVNFIDPKTGGLRPVAESFEELHRKMSSLPLAQRAERLKKAFEILGITPATAIAGNTASIKELMAALESAEGTAKRGADIINGGLGGAFRRLIALVEVVNIELGEIFSEEIQSTITSMGKFINTIMEFIKTNKEMVLDVGKAAFIIGGLGASILAIGTIARFVQYGLFGFLSVVNLIAGVTMLLEGPASRIMRSARLMSAGVLTAFRRLNDNANILLGRMKVTFGNLASSAFNMLGAGISSAVALAVRALSSLPSVASSVASGLRTAFSNATQFAKQFWMGLTGTSVGMVGGFLFQFRALGSQIRALGAALRTHGPAAITFIGYFIPFVRHMKIASQAVYYFTRTLLGFTTNMIPLSKLNRFAVYLGAYSRWYMLKFYNNVKYGFDQAWMAIRIFTTAVRGLPLSALFPGATLAAMFAYQRAIWMVGARINYTIRSIVGAMGGSRLAAFARQAYIGARLLSLAAIGTKLTAGQYAAFTPFQRAMWMIGAQINYRIVRPFMTGMRAVGAIGKEVFRVLGRAGVIASMTIAVAWKAMAPTIATTLRVVVGGALRALVVVGRTSARLIAAGFRTAMGGFSALANVISMAFGTVGGPIGTIIAVIPSILMLAPTLFGLLNPISLLVIALAGAAVYWFKFTDSGQQAFARIKAAIEPFVRIFMMTFQGIKDALEAGDLGLAMDIAMAGMKAAFFKGLESMAVAIGGPFGNALGKIGTQLFSGDFAGAWATALDSMTALWDLFSMGVLEVFSKVITAVSDQWYGLVDGLANKILDLAGEGGVLGDAISTILGVDVAAEKERMKQLNAQARKMGLAETDTDKLGREAITQRSGEKRNAIANYLKELRDQTAARAAGSYDTLDKTTKGGLDGIGLASAASTDELVRLSMEARKAAEEVRKRREEEELGKSPGEFEGGEYTGGVPDSGLPTGSTNRFAETATFSAYAAMAANVQQSSIAQQHLNIARESKAALVHLKDTLDKIDGSYHSWQLAQESAVV